MIDDSANPVVRLCAKGMAIEGEAPAARALFEQAWALRRDDYDACIAAHFLARHQSTLDETLRWNEIAARHAEAVADDRARSFLASLYLNLGDAHRALGHVDDAQAAAERARATLAHVPEGGYRDFVSRAIDRLAERLASDREGTA